MAKPRTLVGAALAKTGLSQEVRDEIEGIRAELDAQYRDRFIEMTQAILQQASALNRIQRTLELLLEHSAPELKGRVPGLRIAGPGEDVDVATIAADPIGAGYSLGQQAIADALHCSQSDISVLLNERPLKDKPELAVVVRRGPQREIINYHPRAVDTLLKLIERPPADATPRMVKAIERIRKRRRLPPA
jgi:hypothetical protein